MFQPNCRIEKFGGVRFYEQDILYDDYVYSNDIQIVLDVDYMTPGIGIALMNNEGMPLKEQKDIYLFRLGYREATVVYRLEDVIKKMSATSILLCPPQENLKIVFQKSGKKVTLSVEPYGTLIEYMLPNAMDKYSFGIYSNAGNVVKDISIASSIPDFWNVNMRNTNGGHLKFFKNGFTLSDCENDAEIEQENIVLSAGQYLLKYDTVDDSDIQCYVVPSGDDRLYDTDKNILANGKFTLAADGLVNIKFKGKHGTIQNIHITDKESDVYVSTKDAQATIEGSYISVNTNELASVSWTGTVYDVPFNNDPSDIMSSSILINADESLPWSIPGMTYSKEYSYTYDAFAHTLTVKDKDTTVYTRVFSYRAETITIFKNMDAVITQFTLIKNDGEVINLIAEKTSKRYVPASITSPIVVVDEEDVPLDLSSSYRVFSQDGIDKYVFTNYEREIFLPDTYLHLTNRPSEDVGSVKVYGIPLNAVVNYDNIFRIPEEGMDTISMFANKFKPIKESELHYLDKLTGEVYLNEVDDYQLIVVDYLKRNSYCVNLISDMNMYEVDVSSSSDTFLVYDHKQDSSNSNVSYISSYKMTEITPEDKNYIVLRREGF